MPAELTPNARIVLEHRYLKKDEAGRVAETPDGMFWRVARAVAEADRLSDGPDAAARFEEAYFRSMSDLLFLPNSPTLMNAGTAIGQLAACFVVPVGDSIPEIFGAVRDMAIIHQSGGGVGFAFSRLREKGASVRETGGVASGPVSFMRVFDVATDVVKQGGRRRGANMAVLSVDHPDVIEFATAKDDRSLLTNFNLSLAVPDAFMHAVEADERWPLVSPRDGRPAGELPARDLWRTICEATWRNGDPGLLFVDEINRHNPIPALGRLEATNPCGEAPLLPYEACNLGSINLAGLVGPGGLDWPRLAALVQLGVRFLDNVIDVSRYPLPQIEQMARANRKIGLGVMGFAEALITLGIPYASDEALAFAGQVMAFIAAAARRASFALAERRGPFPTCASSVWPSRGAPAIRNATLLTVAPTGTLSIIAGTSSGVEPLFALCYTRTVLDGAELEEVNPLFVAALERHHLPVERIVDEVAATGSAQGVAAVPPELRRLFQTALDVPPAWHVRVQAAVQRHADNGVSKTVNLPAAATADDVRATFDLAWRLRCKGVTVFRYGSRGEQVLHLGRIPAFVSGPDRARAHAEYAGECRLCSV
ncbi:MAG: adenosylcobalamin-dependent ribonucleoside-diphosphate reductase [Chloroflexi bacterium]|nr:adenosylcobalamin-dependent ribonucleoside-diphosphate reductase [Chloroflexota bacterium]